MIYLYTKHPPHNLGGENYPNFRNTTDKNSYCSFFVDTTEYGKDLLVQRSSFDTAKLVVNRDTPLFNVAGLKEVNNNVAFYWWVVEWESGAQAESITLILRLDYWLTYWPLAFNDSIVKIERRHAPRYLKQTDNSFKVAFNVQDGSPHLFAPENENVPADVPNNDLFTLEKWTDGYYQTQMAVAMFKGSVVGIANTASNYFDETTINFNDVTASDQMCGWAFINRDGSYLERRVIPNAMLNYQYVTNGAWFYLKTANINSHYPDSLVDTSINNTTAKTLKQDFSFTAKRGTAYSTTELNVVTLKVTPQDLALDLPADILYMIIEFLASLILFAWLSKDFYIPTRAIQVGDYLMDFYSETDASKRAKGYYAIFISTLKLKTLQH